MGLRKIYGKGINDADYSVFYVNKEGVRVVCPVYTRWKNILRRCYSRATQEGTSDSTYKGCRVSEEWLRFSSFKEWLVSQNNWENLFIDKDIKELDSRLYSKDTCLLVTREVNNFLQGLYSRRGIGLRGVSYRKDMSLYESRVTHRGKVAHLSYHSTPEEAHLSWLNAKIKIGKTIAQEQEDEKVKEALLKLLEELPNHSLILIKRYNFEKTD